MKGNYTVYDQLYAQIRAAGEPGWGGRERLAKEGLWLERLLGQSQVPQRGKVLELGCGEGHFTRLLRQKGYQVTGADVSAQAIEWAEAKARSMGLQIDYFVADLTLPESLAPQCYDLIVDGNCLHCIIDQDRSVFLGNVFQTLRPGGVFFCQRFVCSGHRDRVALPRRLALSPDCAQSHPRKRTAFSGLCAFGQSRIPR